MEATLFYLGFRGRNGGESGCHFVASIGIQSSPPFLTSHENLVQSLGWGYHTMNLGHQEAFESLRARSPD